MSKSNKIGKNKSKTNTKLSDSLPIMFAMGQVDLIFKLNLSDKDLEKPLSKENSNNEENQDKKSSRIF